MNIIKREKGIRQNLEEIKRHMVVSNSETSSVERPSSNRRLQITSLPEDTPNLISNNREIERRYEEKVTRIVAMLNGYEDDIQKVIKLVDYFKRNFYYYTDYLRNDKGQVIPETFCNETGYSKYVDKEAVLLSKYGICQGLSTLFADILKRVGIECDCLKNGIHMWNVIYTDEGLRYIDLSSIVSKINQQGKIDWNDRRTVSNFEEYFKETEDGLKTYSPLSHGGGKFEMKFSGELIECFNKLNEADLVLGSRQNKIQQLNQQKQDLLKLVHRQLVHRNNDPFQQEGISKPGRHH